MNFHIVTWVPGICYDMYVALRRFCDWQRALVGSKKKAMSLVVTFVFTDPRNMVLGFYSSLWKRVIAWERSRAASANGIIWGDAGQNKHGGI